MTTTIDWTPEQKLRELIRLPWTVRIGQGEANYLVARVEELPEVLATGADETELMRDLWDSIEASILSRQEFGESFPLPRGTQLPWERGEQPPVLQRRLAVTQRGEAWEAATETTAATHAFPVHD